MKIPLKCKRVNPMVKFIKQLINLSYRYVGPNICNILLVFCLYLSGGSNNLMLKKFKSKEAK